jgi:excisionase family DNA binding protein
MDYFTVEEAARIIGCSKSRIYQYVKSGRLSAQRMGPMLFLSPTEVKTFHNTNPHGRQRGNAPPWRAFKQGALKLLATVITIHIFPGMEEKVQAMLLEDLKKQKHIFTVNVARYIMEDSGVLEIVLVWKNTEMPGEITRQHDLQAFRQAFEDVLDWSTATYALKKVWLHT